MTEFHTVKRIDNSRLVRVAAPGRLWECARRAAWGLALAGFFMIYAWQHFQGIQLRYELEQLREDRARAVALNQELKIQVVELRAPMRIDALARQQLGMTVPLPGQVAPSQAPPDAVLAQMRLASATRP
jgi:cell division protein FtsL